MGSFLVNPDDGTINIHYDGLNPTEVMNLIRLMDSNAKLLMMKNQKPLDVFHRSARRNPITKELSFQFKWSGNLYRVNLDQDQIEAPNPTDVELTEEEWSQYLETFRAMIA